MNGTHQYRLAQHVAACASGPYGVLLDLKRARYLGIGPVDHSRIAAVVSDWPERTHAPQAYSSDESDLSEFIQDMLRQGLLVRASARRDENRSPQPSFTNPEVALIPGYVTTPVRVTTADVLRFTYAVIRARSTLKFAPMERTVTRLRRNAAHTQNSCDLDDARTRVLAFQKLSPLLLTEKGACLLHSLALREFLHFYHHRPRLIIGVKVTPFFSAHAWLQQGNVVFNDDPINVAGYAPILSA